MKRLRDERAPYPRIHLEGTMLILLLVPFVVDLCIVDRVVLLLLGSRGGVRVPLSILRDCLMNEV